MTVLNSLFQYKAWANGELFPVVRTVDPLLHPKEVETMTRTLNHIYVVDRIFRAHLCDEAHGYTVANTPVLPDLDVLHFDVAETDQWYCTTVPTLSATSLDERIRFQFTDGDRGEMSREEILHHVLAHGAYHRGNVGQVLKNLGVVPPRDLFTKFLHVNEPVRRG